MNSQLFDQFVQKMIKKRVFGYFENATKGPWETKG